MPKTYAQMVEEARAAVICTSSEDLKARLDAGEDLLLIDVREPQEWAQGTLPGAYTIPRGVLEGQIDGRVPYESRVVLYCGSGARSALAARSLREMGYCNVENLDGGFAGWLQAGNPVRQ
jgi:rhodanese-related sulfurtransferase